MGFLEVAIIIARSFEQLGVVILLAILYCYCSDLSYDLILGLNQLGSFGNSNGIPNYGRIKEQE